MNFVKGSCIHYRAEIQTLSVVGVTEDSARKDVMNELRDRK